MPKVEMEIITVDTTYAAHTATLRPTKNQGCGPAYQFPINNDTWWGSRIGKKIILTASDE